MSYFYVETNHYPSGTCRCGRVGNNWSDYGGNDPDGDGIGSPAYDIGFSTAAFDYYPLMHPWLNYALVKCGDVNGDGDPNAGDMSPLFAVVISTCDWAADVNCDGDPNAGDMSPLFEEAYNCCCPCTGQ